MIIALGESIVAAGVGIGRQELTASLVTAAVLTIAATDALWWTYFDALALAAAACWTLIAYELLRHGDARQRYRHTEELPA